MPLTKLTDDQIMTPSSWAAYDDVARGGKFAFAKPLPGWRIEYVFKDGRIGDYSDSGARTGYCRVEQRSNFVPISFSKSFAQAARSMRSGPKPAIDNCHECKCGYRQVRNVYELLRYYGLVQVFFHKNPKPYHTRLFGGHVIQYRGQPVATVLTRVCGYGTAERPFGDDDPQGTIRVSKTRLVEVFLPTLTDQGEPVPTGVAQKIRGRYGVTVRKIDGDLLDFQGTKDMPLPDDWRHYVEPIREEIEETKQYIAKYGYDAAAQIGERHKNG